MPRPCRPRKVPGDSAGLKVTRDGRALSLENQGRANSLLLGSRPAPPGHPLLPPPAPSPLSCHFCPFCPLVPRCQDSGLTLGCAIPVFLPAPRRGIAPRSRPGVSAAGADPAAAARARGRPRGTPACPGRFVGTEPGRAEPNPAGFSAPASSPSQGERSGADGLSHVHRVLVWGCKFWGFYQLWALRYSRGTVWGCFCCCWVCFFVLFRFVLLFCCC